MKEETEKVHGMDKYEDKNRFDKEAATEKILTNAWALARNDEYKRTYREI